MTSNRHELETGRVSLVAGFRSIVVALDLSETGDRALPVVRALAERGGLPVELLTVSSPNLAENVDAYELSRRAEANGWPEHSYTIAHDNQPARALVDHIDRTSGALLVMATSAKPPLAGHLLGSVSEDVLSIINQPVLLVGPHVPDDYTMTQPTLVVCVDRTDVADAAVPAIADWTETFGGAEPWVTEVIPTGASAVRPGTDESSHVRRYAKHLAEESITASWGVLHGGETEVRLDDFGDRVTDPVFLATSVRWTDGRLHWRSTTRRLVHRSTRPVLVVPARHQAESA